MPNRPEKLQLCRAGFGCSAVVLREARRSAPAAISAAARKLVVNRIILAESLEVAADQREAGGAAASAGFALASTASAIEAGIGLVFSTSPSTGSTTSRKPK